MTFTVHEVPSPSADDDTLHPLARAYLGILADHYLAEYGHSDFVSTERAFLELLRGSRAYTTRLWVALASKDGEAEEVVGGLSAELTCLEDLDHAYLECVVSPRARRQGVGTALLDRVTRETPDRTIQMAWVNSPDATDAPGALIPAVGVGAVDPDRASSRFLLRHGFALEQAERASTLTLNEATLATAAELGAAAATQAADYDTVVWTHRVPEDRIEQLAVLRRAMSTDIPMGDLDFDPQEWDPERIREREDSVIRAGQDRVWTAARHIGDDELVAFTEVHWDRELPEAVIQGDTLVRGDHRGHRLGMLIKTTNLAQLHQLNPAAARIHTWNAVENGPMLDINIALGFKPSSVEGAWRRTLAGDGS